MTPMDILDTQIKGITGRILIYLFSIGFTILITIMGTYYATKAQITELRADITLEIRGDKAEQKLTDTIQDRRLDDLTDKLAKK